MTKLLNVKSTAYPNGTRTVYKFGMPKPKPLHLDINRMIREELSKTKNLKRI
jgi:hypothetical protein